MALHRLGRQVLARGLSTLWSGAFADFGAHTVIEPPVRLRNVDRIELGARVSIGPGCWLVVLAGAEGTALRIGDGTSIAGDCVLSAASSVVLGSRVLLARGVYVADHRHAFEDPGRPVLEQGIADVRPVEIGDGAWLGQNVVICPGVRIGRGAVIGANAVVRDDVPDHAVAAGVPARVVRTAAEVHRTSSAPASGRPPSGRR